MSDDRRIVLSSDDFDDDRPRVEAADRWTVPTTPPPGTTELLGPPPAGTSLGGTAPPRSEHPWAPPVVQPALPPYYGTAPSAEGASTAALVLGIVGMFCVPLVPSILAWVIGAGARRRARAIPGQPGYGSANAGFILGIIGTILWIAVIAFYIIVIVGIASTDWDSY
ncbi:DUF4190 domain-containing protein [Patulibacter sp. NPDC049589]|uniref:DUF4190 domain-containing protein n=1 Tax=Patulibacter sp. NPDC049589 TaxID=3154731 RepID=UPI00342BC1B6